MSCTCKFGKGLKVNHCVVCHETFTSLTAFDRHWRGGHRLPQDAGLVQRGNGRWSLPSRGAWK